MPSIRVNGTEIYYEEHGSGDEAIVFSHGLLFDHRMFDRQVAVFRDRYRCIAYDHRGQGWSETPEGPVADIETVYEDAAALLEALGAVPCHFAGVSMGGFVGMRLAARRPEMLRSLILINTAPDPEPDENVPRYRKLNLVARWLGPRLVAGRVLPVMTGESTRNDPNRASEVREWKRRIGRNRRSIYKAVNGVMQRDGVEEELGRVSTPTLVLAGEED
ncbi:MAG: alpha/beta fold hydrolase, partial [Chloroflexota bacterium]